MFSNIEKYIGLRACEEALNKREVNIPNTLCILEALELCLDNNIASFNGTTYVQVKGTATGPAFSCSYADITVDLCIDRIVMSENNPWKKHIPAWARFRDDIYLPWIGTAEERVEFFDWLHGLVPALQFVMSDIKPEGVVRLDMLVYSKDGKIHTKITSKACDPHAYLLPLSCHPTHIYNNIPYGVLQRVKKNCSNQAEAEEE